MIEHSLLRSNTDMNQPRQMLTLFLVFGGLMIGWQYIQNQIWPPRVIVVQPLRETAMIVGGGPMLALKEVSQLRPSTPPPADASTTPDAVAKVEGKEPEAKRGAPARKPSEPNELVGMGWVTDDVPVKPNLRVLLSRRGGAVQQVVLNQFQMADREGLPVFNEIDGIKKPRPLPLLAGVLWEKTNELRDQQSLPLPELAPGKLDPATEKTLSRASYLMYHYERSIDDRPLDTLGTRMWDIESNSTDGDSGTQTVVFKTTLDAPFFATIRRVYTLNPKEYHIGMRVDIERQAGQKGNPLRYQVSGPVNMPIEGEWYTATFRQALIGYVDRRSNATRTIEDPISTRHSEGGDRHIAGDRIIQYAGVALQFFASVLAVDDEQPGKKMDFLEYARTTTEGDTHRDKPFLDEMTTRVVSKEIAADASVSHQYLLYNGPVKVRLLRQLGGVRDVDNALVAKYLDRLHLNTLTDAPMPNFFGRFANAIFWTDIVIAFTNLIHGLLWALNQVIPNLGVCIIVLTFMVRMLLHPLGRKAAANGQIMQAKMAELAPQIKELEKKYEGDFNKLRQEKAMLMFANGINPLSSLGGCLPLLAQMPIFMGLYYAIQESIFLRLEPFLWIPNLAAPDMLFRFGEDVPFLSKPDSLGSGLYVGPFFNILPFVSVGLMLYQQIKTMPKAVDEQQAMQQKMMKFMLILFAFMFYKVAAGLCIYFIVSSIWGIVERRLIPKPKLGTDGKVVSKTATAVKAAEIANALNARGKRPGSRSNSRGGSNSRGNSGNNPKAPTPDPTTRRGKFSAWWQKVLEEAKKKQK